MLTKQSMHKLAQDYRELGINLALEQAGLLKLANPNQTKNPQDAFKTTKMPSVTKRYTPSPAAPANRGAGGRKVDPKASAIAQKNLNSYLRDGLDHSHMVNTPREYVEQNLKPATDLARKAYKAYSKKQIPLGGGFYAGKIKGNPGQPHFADSRFTRQVAHDTATGRGLSKSPYGITFKGTF
tara:strand:- start:71755 stop:72300 length:546 start_codon:yes stop_codon:yes gene_type:complete